ncbi:MAG: helix-turn-helix transcriptional regulator [Clostridia bacterium]|nr:helix-turn-helix transcriptional regulator [Clostridia bacterium]
MKPANRNEILTERLKTLFDEDPRTDTAIADSLGVSKQVLSNWRHGISSPKRAMVDRIAEIYGVTASWILGYTDVRTSSSSMMHWEISPEDRERLESMHLNPRLGLLFDRSRHMSKDDVEFMLQFANRILQERDGDD